MPRWDPQAEERLRAAAIELYLERGFENVTVTQIAGRAGLTRRTFSRYFADKRDVLFAGSEQLPAALAEALLGVDPGLSPFEALLKALTEVGAVLADRVVLHAAERRAVIAGSSELQERGRTKFAAVADALAAALRQRGMEASGARLLADVGVAIFRTGFDRWVDSPEDADLAARIGEAAGELAGAVSPLLTPTFPRNVHSVEGIRNHAAEANNG
ncbi:MAG: TetR family transcriptional regulator [Chloroflexi bacterium]|nr:TetR family transcriptional regulator [Chloroflexota bacterium]